MTRTGKTSRGQSARSDTLKKHSVQGRILATVTIPRGGLDFGGGPALFPNGLSFIWREGENWLVSGPNGCGKSVLVQLLSGERFHPDAEVELFFSGPDGSDPERSVAVVSPERHSRLLDSIGAYVQMRWNASDEESVQSLGSWLSQDAVEGRLPCERFVRSPESEAAFAARRCKVVSALDISALLGNSLVSLSNGEMRRAMLARALLGNSRLLLFDAPFVGLDADSRELLLDAISRETAKKGVSVMLASMRPEFIPAGINRELALDSAGRVLRQGPWSGGCSRPSRKTPPRQPKPGIRHAPTKWRVEEAAPPDTTAKVLVQMKDVSVAYGSRVVFENLNWTVRAGEHWAVSGPNGCGKTTLLALLLGDHPQAYASDVTLFGRRRGTGESIWDVKKRIGWVSPELHACMERTPDALSVVVSGFRDSPLCLGPATARERRAAAAALARFGLTDAADAPFGSLSWGMQRLVLLARAMVKNPKLLVLDEPCQNLDLANRDLFLKHVDSACAASDVALICVSHLSDCIPSCVDRRLVACRA